MDPPCVGCRTRGKHAYVAVMYDAGLDRFVPKPVCEHCWRDPGHRKVPLKAHFFPAAQAIAAANAAGRGYIG